MDTINILGIDIAKNTFQLHGADHSGKAVYEKAPASAPTCRLYRKFGTMHHRNGSVRRSQLLGAGFPT